MQGAPHQLDGASQKLLPWLFQDNSLIQINKELSSLLNDKIRELEKKDKVLSELTSSLNDKVKQLENTNEQLQVEKKHSDELNSNLKSALKKLSDAEMQLKIERDWLAEQVEKKSLEVLQTIDQLIKAENDKS